MKLYLSSYQFGNHPEELTKLADSRTRAAVIMNAVDYGDQNRRRLSVQQQVQQLQALGFGPRELDLRNYFGKVAELKAYLARIDLLWIHGGNSFVLQRAFHQSGLSLLIKDAVKSERIIYAGFSAAVCVASPTLRGVELVDDPEIVPAGYEKDFAWDGLGLINYHVAAHYQSDHPESASVEKEIAFFEDTHIPYKTLKDGEVIIVQGGQERIRR